MEHGYFIFAAHFPGYCYHSWRGKRKAPKRRKNEILHFTRHRTGSQRAYMFPWKQKLGKCENVIEIGWEPLRIVSLRHPSYTRGRVSRNWYTVVSKYIVTSIIFLSLFSLATLTYANPDANQVRALSLSPFVRSFSTNPDRNLYHQSRA